ncbi:shikimate O-hydroxycinnamoyltransferase-like protein [Tanacetum coccineum]
MAGRMGRDESGRLVINCNNEGALFVEAESDTCLDDLSSLRPISRPSRRKVKSGSDSFETSYWLIHGKHSIGVPTILKNKKNNKHWLSKITVKVTHFKCGGVALGCGVFHTLSDGLSSLHFINTWSDVARGASVYHPNPSVNEPFIGKLEPPPPTSIYHVEYHQPPSMNTITQKSGSISKSSTRMLKLTLEQLNTLKAKAKAESGHNNSTYEILAAHIWRCACKARGLPDDQLTKLYVATDGRSRLSPHLPPGYLGNVVFTATPVDKSGNLTKGSLSNTAKLIHNTLTKMDNDYLRSAIDYLEVQPDMSALVRGPSYFASPNLNINAWTRLPVHEADFGYGRPIFMGPACILYEGTIYVLPSPNNDRSMSLAVCLDASEQLLFEKFLYEI